VTLGCTLASKGTPDEETEEGWLDIGSIAVVCILAAKGTEAEETPLAGAPTAAKPD